MKCVAAYHQYQLGYPRVLTGNGSRTHSHVHVGNMHNFCYDYRHDRVWRNCYTHGDRHSGHRHGMCLCILRGSMVKMSSKTCGRKNGNQCYAARLYIRRSSMGLAHHNLDKCGKPHVHIGHCNNRYDTCSRMHHKALSSNANKCELQWCTQLLRPLVELIAAKMSLQ